jgi:hypothetical protein
MLRRMPFLKLLAIAQTVLLARRHFQRLNSRDRRRLSELVRAFAASTADALSPVPLPRWLAGRSGR